MSKSKKDALPPGYIHDVFISYTRKDPVGTWVQRYFFPRLQMWLGTCVPWKPEIFIDTKIQTGAEWPSDLRERLLRSRCLVAIWLPSYFFQSSWCMAEWQTMRERERMLGLHGRLHPGLVYPIVYSDGDHFPEEARNTQSRDMSKYRTELEIFAQSIYFLEFDLLMQKIAEEIADRIMAAPPWDKDWPFVEPGPLLPPPGRFPRLR